MQNAPTYLSGGDYTGTCRAGRQGPAVNWELLRPYSGFTRILIQCKASLGLWLFCSKTSAQATCRAAGRCAGRGCTRTWWGMGLISVGQDPVVLIHHLHTVIVGPISLCLSPQQPSATTISSRTCMCRFSGGFLSSVTRDSSLTLASHSTLHPSRQTLDGQLNACVPCAPSSCQGFCPQSLKGSTSSTGRR